MYKVVVMVVAAVSLCGCTAMVPLVSSFASPLTPQPGQALTQTSVNLQEKDFTLVRTNVLGVSRGFSLLGLIPIVPATVIKATGQMYARGRVQENRPQTMANVIIEHSSLYFILFSIPKVTVRADIVEFNSAPPPTNSQPFNSHPIHPPSQAGLQSARG